MKGFKASVLYGFIMMSVFAIVLAACGGGGGGGGTALVSIAVTPADPNIKIGATRQFTATGAYSDGGAQDLTSSVTWSSSNTAAATVSNAGLATSASAGVTTITAASGDKSGMAELTVKSAVSLPRTGQTESYDSNDPQRDDGALQKGVAWPDPRFETNADTTVTDNLTGLIWAPDGNIMPTRDNGWDGDGTANDGRVTWQHALDYVAILNAENYLSYSDWRLPNRKELMSLIDRSKYGPALPEGHLLFTNVQSGFYWSSTTDASNTVFAWVVYYMWSGSVNVNNKASGNYVWPVRSGQEGAPAELPETGQTTCYNEVGVEIECPGTGQDGELQRGVAWPDPRFAAGTGAEADCVTDNLTGLMWAKDGNLPGTKTWQEALNYVASLNSEDGLCGYTDWRLPNVNELESMVNAGEVNTATWLNIQGFNNVQAGYYWSSTTYAYNTGYAWYVNMWFGVVFGDNKTFGYYVWPVRSGQ